MAKKIQRDYKYRGTDKDRGVRYAIEWHFGTLEYMVRRALANKTGKSHDGPITVHIHPDDRRA
jgi:hypothetical protein